jgi:hypothetical protein
LSAIGRQSRRSRGEPGRRARSRPSSVPWPPTARQTGIAWCFRLE